MKKKLFVKSAADLVAISKDFDLGGFAEFEAIGPNGTKVLVFLTHGGVDGSTTADEVLRMTLEGNPELLVVCCHPAAVRAVWGCKTLFDQCSNELYVFWRTKGRPHLEVWDEPPDLHLDDITII
jgi:hypothetical protein